MTVTAYIALGSNLGDRPDYIDRALDALRQHPGIKVSKVSTYRETDPVGGPAGQGKYLNAAAELHTDLPAGELLRTLLAVESGLGRFRQEKNGPRTIDLDLLLYGDSAIQEADLVIPHPRMHERLFVLEPLAEIAPELVHPAAGVTIQHLAGHARAHEMMDQVREEVNRYQRQYQSLKGLLQANPHPRKRRHLERKLTELDKEGAELDSRIQAVNASLHHFHQDESGASCHPPS